MLSKTILAFAGMMAAAQAILVTSPTKGEAVDFSKTVKVTWTSVNTDPSTFSLVLVNQDNNIPIPVATTVQTSSNEFDVSNFVVAPGSAYKFNFISTDPLNSGILAQSQTFTVTTSGVASSSSSSSSSTSSSTGDGTTTTTSGAAATTAAPTTTGTGKSSTTLTKSSSTTTIAKTSSTGAASGTGAANASSTATPIGNAAVSLSGAKSVVVAGGLLAGLFMLL